MSHTAAVQPPYSMLEHRHRLAVWVAGRAYSRKGSGHTMEVAQALIENSGLSAIASPDDLPEPGEIDAFIHSRIEAVIRASVDIPQHKHWKTGELRSLECTYGRAQKLVNMYLKSKIICVDFASDIERLSALHPPLDDQLLTAIDSNKDHCPPETKARFKGEWANARRLGTKWTKFNQATYDAYIKAIRTFLAGRPMWQIEYLWQPVSE
jgi:hypothetical protein